MPAKQVALALGFAVFWTLISIWWSNDYTTANIVIFTVMGLIVGFAWVWVMRRFGYIRW